jgi:hypothetical protein
LQQSAGCAATRTLVWHPSSPKQSWDCSRAGSTPAPRPPAALPQALSTPHYPLSSLPTYFVPEAGSLQSYKDYIAALPVTDRPEAFGQHGNAEISYLREDSRVVLDTLLALQPADAGAWAAGCCGPSHTPILFVPGYPLAGLARSYRRGCCEWEHGAGCGGAGPALGCS